MVVPAAADWLCVAGVSTGFARPHAGWLKLTLTPALLPFTPVDVIVTPALLSVKLWPTARAGLFQSKEVVVFGVMSSRLLVSGPDSEPLWITTPLVKLLSNRAARD